MNDSIKTIIQGQKDYFYNTFIIVDPAIDAEINSYYEQSVSFGEPYTDPMEFTTAFTTSPLQAKFTEIYMRCSQNCQQRNPDPTIPKVEVTASDVVSEVGRVGENILDGATQPMRSRAHQEQMDTLRGIPVVGEMMQADNTVSIVKRFFGKKRDEE